MLHSDFKPATWRGTTATDGKTIGLSFNLLDGKVARYALNVDSALEMAATLLDHIAAFIERTNTQSDADSGMPRSAVSPQDGQNV